MQLPSLLISALGLTSLTNPPPFSPASTCSNPSLSCPSTPPSNPDTCCLNHPSGHFLLTQFWDASPTLGSPTNWTIHGLWPDLCHGGFDQFCDRTRERSNIAGVLAAKAPKLLEYMYDHWLSLNGDNNHLWSHEWNKHGTCISTLEPGCYDSEEKGGERDDEDEAVVSYFTHAATVYTGLDTYATLAAAGIVPSRERGYSLEELQKVITQSHGFPVTLRCRGSELQEIWYHYSVRGPLRHAMPFDEHSSAKDSIFVPTDPDIAKSNCPSQNIRYLPKSSRAPHPTHVRPTQTATHTSTPTKPAGRPFSGRGHLLVRQISTEAAAPSDRHQMAAGARDQKVLTAADPSHNAVHIDSDTKGCLIRAGLWYASGGCATYLAQSDAPHFPLPQRLCSSSSHDTTFHPEFEPIPNESDLDREAEEPHMFTLSSLYAPCAIVGENAKFTCGNDLGVQAIFEGKNVTRLASAAAAAASERDAIMIEEAEGKDEKTVTREVLAWRGRTTFYADNVPGRFEKVEIFADNDGGKREVALEIEWESI